MDGFDPEDRKVDLEQIRRWRREFEIREETGKEKLKRGSLFAAILVFLTAAVRDLPAIINFLADLVTFLLGTATFFG